MGLDLLEKDQKADFLPEQQDRAISDVQNAEIPFSIPQIQISAQTVQCTIVTD